jgi:hypothetical protein
MTNFLNTHKAAIVGVALLLAPCLAQADRWDVRGELAEGNREIRQERREAIAEIATADTPWEARHEIREGGREIRHERREARREVRREVYQSNWGW